ncbi:MAG: hypothetical protein A2785_00420 [Candidatus Chisholmbacteria bacterium RIFCSPHIGHO2_01_FULL_49_18]|uniref:Single-stranded-DNA-specific exonuclease RecJ n=2 Tax=Candidatus Chisholmiibacteriota TaxID=1817900 RepID=A0A1G1VPJ4_9BACT|nr:MAG: hypothetical protein A2785_00420 [Candidatus Chisholmbacteria bacterium RIFCSPHIGHO2_01_FULL_49_18]OGY20925.1 MAG: hypothetical protein A3A65_00665 [Candidatus Chisholmbacteria bacterium RIFCSPLOWO2_01_FULL_49_14]
MQWVITKAIEAKSPLARRDEITRILLTNRGIVGEAETREYLTPQKPDHLTAGTVNISLRELKKAVKRIETAIRKKEHIVVYGDYDADGICSTAILWEALHSLGADTLPFIPLREKHGYGLSIKGIDDLLNSGKVRPSGKIPTISRDVQSSKVRQGRTLSKPPSLIITVDNGIVAFDAVEYAFRKGIDVIICDHHEKAKKLPKAMAIIHTTLLSGSGVAWVFAKEIIRSSRKKAAAQKTLDLATIGTVADMVPLLGPNRSLVKYGLSVLQKHSRIGLKLLLQEAAVEPEALAIYHINYVIAPRLNAMGRLEHALDALRLICTKSPERARELAQKLGTTNRRRQELTEEMLNHAKKLSGRISASIGSKKILIIDHQDFHEGVIGLIAGKLVEEYYRPVIVVAKGGEISKASARSIAGFNIIKAIRKTEHLLIDAGGHPMAAGFTIRTENIQAFKKLMLRIASVELSPDLLQPKLSLDAQILLNDVTWELYEKLEGMEPFGIANPKPAFAIREMRVVNTRAVGREKQHLKLTLAQGNETIDGIAFSLGNLAAKLRGGSQVDVAATLEQNIWNGRKELQLRVKDIKSLSLKD